MTIHYLRSAEAREARRQHLVRLMGEHRLTCADVAQMLDRSPGYVRDWRSVSDARDIPDHSLALLELLLRHGYREVAA